MAMKPILISLLLLYTAISDTDLSTNNCPSDFNMTIANVSTGIGMGDLAKFFYSVYMD